MAVSRRPLERHVPAYLLVKPLVNVTIEPQHSPLSESPARRRELPTPYPFPHSTSVRVADTREHFFERQIIVAFVAQRSAVVIHAANVAPLSRAPLFLSALPVPALTARTYRLTLNRG
jgi:hypothetical protein